VSLSLLDPFRPTWAEIDLDRLAANLRAVRTRVGERPVLAVVKANAYGHGAVEVAKALEAEGVAWLGVALPEEGVELRRAGVKAAILLLGGFAPPQAELLLEHDLLPAIYRLDQAEALAGAAARRGVEVRAHLKIDTGMGRLGVPASEVPAFAGALATAGRIRLTGAFSHLAVADEPKDPFTARQIERFQKAIEVLRSRGFDPQEIHLANSAAILDHPPAWLTLVRPGIALYGYPPSSKVTPLDVRPVLSWKTRIIYLKEVPPGTSLGYGRTYVTKRSARIASLALGYDDGLPRLLSNRGHVLVRGRRAPIVGRISMDLTTVDVTGVPGVSQGDEAVLIGSSGSLTLTAAEIAAWAETIHWEVLCRLGSRVPRLYLKRGADPLLVSRFATALF
jgi:alanine racemase